MSRRLLGMMGKMGHSINKPSPLKRNFNAKQTMSIQGGAEGGCEHETTNSLSNKAKPIFKRHMQKRLGPEPSLSLTRLLFNAASTLRYLVDDQNGFVTFGVKNQHMIIG